MMNVLDPVHTMPAEFENGTKYPVKGRLPFQIQISALIQTTFVVRQVCKNTTIGR